MDRRQFLSRLLLGTALIAIFTILINAEATLPWLWDKVSTVLSPILGGIAIAFILSIPSKRIEKTLEGRLGKGVRLISLVLSVALIILFLSLVIALVVPEFINACSILIDSLKAFASDESFWERIDLSAIPFVNDMLGGVDDSITTLAELLESKIQEFSAPILSFTIQSLIYVIQGSVSFFVAAVFACYFIMNREMLSRHMRKVLSLLLPEGRIGYLVHLERIASSSFSRFIIAQVTEACIIGVLCFAGMLVLRLPYAAAISAFTGLMALIPIYGAIIGAIVGAFIIAVISPIKGLLFLIFIFVLQQAEGDFIYPRVVGTSTGLPSVYVFASVTLGGALCGLGGMLFAVPVFSILFTLIRERLSKDEAAASADNDLESGS